MIDLARDTLKIIDYGAARHSGSQDEVLSHNFETCYNYEYVSPEIFQQAPVGPGTDIWGVGLIMYTMYVPEWCVCVCGGGGEEGEGGRGEFVPRIAVRNVMWGVD